MFGVLDKDDATEAKRVQVFIHFLLRRIRLRKVFPLDKWSKGEGASRGLSKKQTKEGALVRDLLT